MSSSFTHFISFRKKIVQFPGIMLCLLLSTVPLLGQPSQGSVNPPMATTGLLAPVIQVLHALPPVLTTIIGLLFWWLTSHLMMRAFFRPPSTHAPLAARIGLWIGTLAWLASLIWVVLPAYIAFHILGWHILACATLLICFGALLVLTSPKASGRLSN